MGEVTVGSCVRPLPGQTVGGDSAVVRQEAGAVTLVIVDVLGHGPGAHALAVAVESYLREEPLGAPAEVLLAMDGRFSRSRGLAAGVAVVDTETGEVRYAGIGNTAARTFGTQPQRLVSRDGVVGHRARTPQETTARLAEGDLLVMYTDGVSDRFDLRDYPTLLDHEPQEIAESIVAWYGKDHDDAGCLVARLDARPDPGRGPGEEAR